MLQKEYAMKMTRKDGIMPMACRDVKMSWKNAPCMMPAK